MNYIIFSPHFPPSYFLFCKNLHQLGVNVFGIADEPYELLNPELKSSLTEYYQVSDMHNYDQLLRACGFLTHRYGKLDGIESFNEYWLESDARLRTDFNMAGIKAADVMKIRKKSLMKQTFDEFGIPVARGKVIHNFKAAKKYVKEIGFPIVAKPDIGVGAAKTYKITTNTQLEDFFSQKPDVDYIFEEFIFGDILTFDGLTDHSGNPVFYTSHKYSQGIMEVVNNDSDVYYYSLRDIPSDLEEAGRRVLKAFDVRGRFFHFEFFRRNEDQKIIALEVNMRPPGGLTTDMFNFANDFDIYKEWANIIVHNKFTVDYSRPYHCCYIGRKNNRTYYYSHEQILDAFGSTYISHHQPINGVFSAALGDYGYLVRSPELEEIFSMVNFIQKLV